MSNNTQTDAISQLDYPVYQEQGITYLHPIYANRLVENDLLAEATYGGLILGKPIVTVLSISLDNRLYVAATAESGQYVINTVALKVHRQAISDLELQDKALKEEPFTEYAIPADTLLIDARPKLIDGLPVERYVYFGSAQIQFIHRNLAKKHLAFYNRINQQYRPQE